VRARGKSDSKTDSKTGRQTDTQTDCPKLLFSTFWGLYIPNPGLSQSRFFARCQYFHWHGSKIQRPDVNDQCINFEVVFSSEQNSINTLYLRNSPLSDQYIFTTLDYRYYKEIFVRNIFFPRKRSHETPTYRQIVTFASQTSTLSLFFFLKLPFPFNYVAHARLEDHRAPPPLGELQRAGHLWNHLHNVVKARNTNRQPM